MRTVCDTRTSVRVVATPLVASASHWLDAATTEELLRSWETAEHVNNITRLKEMGSDAMLSYARDAIPSDDVLRRAPALPPTRQLAATINAAIIAAGAASSGLAALAPCTRQPHGERAVV